VSFAARGAGPPTHDARLAPICPYEANEEANERSERVRVFELALDCDARGELVLVSGVGGEVTAWDPRCARAAWSAETFRRNSSDIARGAGCRVRGIASSASRRRATAACADGFARALDLRMCGDVCDARFVGLGGLTCAAASGEDIVFVGGEDGRVAAVDWSGGPAAVATYARNDGVSFFIGERGAARAGSGVSCLSVAPGGGALAAGWDDGTVAVFAET
jgi:WD40 repeat protein